MVLSHGWRARFWANLDQPFDIVIIGGGITGAGIFREASRVGMKVLLVDKHDFSSGTSSRSSKLVHGGLRYLKNGQIKTTIESVHERERLLKEGRGLINPLGFLFPCYKGDRIPSWIFGFGLILYDLFAYKWGHRHYDASDLLELCPILAEEDLVGGYRFIDAQADDSRLVLRLIFEGINDNCLALNYANVKHLLKLNNGNICGVLLEDVAGCEINPSVEIKSKIVINATGPWADITRHQAIDEKLNKGPNLRLLRGSHLFFSQERVPLTRAISFPHPDDGRFIFVFPWEGVTIIGTTDVDHPLPIETEVRISNQEIDYLIYASKKIFPNLSLTNNDIQSTFSGVRPVIGTRKADPSKESREHLVLLENNLLTLMGGKLTTFRLMAHSAFKAMRNILPYYQKFTSKMRVLNETKQDEIDFAQINRQSRLRIIGRYGDETMNLIKCANSGELEVIDGTPSIWAELRWAARSEGVIHLDDLLLRRTRLGLTNPNTFFMNMERIETIIKQELGWSNQRWINEYNRYHKLIERFYLP